MNHQSRVPAATGAHTETERLREATVAVVVERGLSGAELPDIAARAGLDADVLAGMTGGRVEPLVLDAYDAVLADLMTRCLDAYGTGPWSVGVRRGTSAVFAAAMEDPRAARFAYIEVPSGGRAMLAARARKRAAWADEFVQRCAASLGERPAALQVELFFGAIRQAVEDHLRRDAIDELPAAMEPLVATFDPPPPVADAVPA